MKQIPVFLTILLLFTVNSCDIVTHTEEFSSYWDKQPDRYWIGPEYWANRLQDWQINNGKLECINGREPLRTVHLIHQCLVDKPGNLEMHITLGKIQGSNMLLENEWTGFMLGAGDLTMDYRRRAIIHRNHGKAGGFIAALNGAGHFVFIDNATGDLLEPISESGQPVPIQNDRSVELDLEMIPKGDRYHLMLTACLVDQKDQSWSAEIEINNPELLTGNIALVAHGGANKNGHSFWYSGWKIKGSKIKTIPDQQYGPVMGVLYTISDNILKLTAQFPPVSQADQREAFLELLDKKSGKWSVAGSSQIIEPGFIAHFRIESWDPDISQDYRIKYQLINNKGSLEDHYYYGLIVKDPEEKEEIVVAAFTGNSNSSPMGNVLFDFKHHLWFPHEDLTSYVAKHQPDLLVYTGDNVYEGRPTPPDFSSVQNTYLDYLYKWYLFCWAHGVLTRNIPAVVIPDDHDVYHGNIWGDGGAKVKEWPAPGEFPDYYKGFESYWQQDQGGYKLPPELVNMVERTQTSNLCDPYDPTQVKQNIGVYYCNLNYGRISFAILEDRKFKSPPSVVLPGKKVVNGFSLIRGIDGRSLDNPNAKLLGDRQLKFLDDWAADWKNVDMKVAISQTIFANLSSFPDTFTIDNGTPRLPPLPWGVIPKDYQKAKDMDSNGWPQTGRNKALKALRKGFAFMIGGDQHLGSIIHHGVDEWEDAGYSFCVPSIANLWPRRWFPPEPGANHQEGMPLYTGRYFDGLGNRVTVWAVSNPYISGKEPALLHDRAPGYGIVKFNRKTQLITIECWPRYADPESFEAEQYPGWPLTISMEDNYKRKALAWLPVIKISGLDHPPVIQVIDESAQEIIYTLRIRDYSYQPKVFRHGTYTVKIGEPGTPDMKELNGISSSPEKGVEIIEVEF
jgi:alkaline phosphatase D